MKKAYTIKDGTVKELKIVNYLQSQFKTSFEQLGNNHAWHCGELNCGIGFDVENETQVKIIYVAAEPQFHPEMKKQLEVIVNQQKLKLA